MKIAIVGQFDSFILGRLGEQHQIFCVPSGQPEVLALADAEILVTRGHFNVTADVLRSLGRLRLLVKAGSGTDNIDVTEAASRGIVVRTTPASTTAVAELALALLLATRRRICFMNEQLHQGNWQAKYRYLGHVLRDGTLGIIGFGRIGQEVARLGAAFGMRILAVDRSPSAVEKQAAAAGIGVVFTSLPDLLREADAISLHVPSLPETLNLLGRPEFSVMRPGAVLINTGRAATVDRQALLDALREERLAGAGLDVFHDEPLPATDPILEFPMVVCTPHIGAQTFETMAEIGRNVLLVIDEFSRSFR